MAGQRGGDPPQGFEMCCGELHGALMERVSITDNCSQGEPVLRVLWDQRPATSRQTWLECPGSLGPDLRCSVCGVSACVCGVFVSVCVCICLYVYVFVCIRVGVCECVCVCVFMFLLVCLVCHCAMPVSRHCQVT